VLRIAAYFIHLSILKTMLMAIPNQQSLLSFERFSCSFERFAQKNGISQIMKNIDSFYVT